MPERDDIYTEYHDKEWGVPAYDDQKLFEMIILEGAQAGLSWITVLKKREEYRIAFDNFNPCVVAKYETAKINQLLCNPGIIRNRLKIEAAVANAKAYIELVSKTGGFADTLWQFVDGKPKINQWNSQDSIPTTSVESTAMSKYLKGHGFKFVGPTICYSFMQAVGMINDHLTECFRYKELVCK